MTDGHRRHLLASLLAVEETTRQMAAVGQEGRSPTGAKALTPLSQEDWEPLAAALTRVQERLQEAVRCIAPKPLAERKRAEGYATTLYWLSYLSLQLEDMILGDLTPARMEKYGALSAEEQESLYELLAGLRSDAAAIREQIERLRGEKGG